MRKEIRTVEDLILSEDDIRNFNYVFYIKLGATRFVLRRHDEMYICRRECGEYRILDKYVRGGK